MGEISTVDVYWRPGCPYCAMLFRRLRRTGLPVRKVNIWSDPTAAAYVRSVADGNETVPTVVVGEVTLVNPSVRQVVTAVAARAPHLAPSTPAAPRNPSPPRTPPAVRPRGLLAMLVAALLWLALAGWRPDTTFHLAPAVVTAAWAAAERIAAGGALGRVRAAVVCAAGAGAALAVTAVLATAGWLAGPALVGGAAWAEALLVIAAAVPVSWWALTRGAGRRRPGRPDGRCSQRSTRAASSPTDRPRPPPGYGSR